MITTLYTELYLWHVSFIKYYISNERWMEKKYQKLYLYKLYNSPKYCIYKIAINKYKKMVGWVDGWMLWSVWMDGWMDFSYEQTSRACRYSVNSLLQCIKQMLPNKRLRGKVSQRVRAKEALLRHRQEHCKHTQDTYYFVHEFPCLLYGPAVRSRLFGGSDSVLDGINNA